MKIAFLDRDGTIIEDYPDNEWRYKTEPVFLNESIDALSKILKKGYQIIIITNQYIINEGIITLVQYKKFTDLLLNELNKHNIKILDIFYCPHSRNENCSCIKPNLGLIEQSMSKYPEIKLKESFIVGDSVVDIKLAERLDIKGFGIKVKSNNKKIKEVGSLKEVIDYI